MGINQENYRNSHVKPLNPIDYLLYLYICANTEHLFHYTSEKRNTAYSVSISYLFIKFLLGTIRLGVY